MRTEPAAPTKQPGGPVGPAAVLFDFNGTLANDELIVAEVYRTIYWDFFGHRLEPADYFERLVGRSDDDIIADALTHLVDERPTTANELRHAIRERYAAAARHAELVTPAAVQFVRDLADGGVRLGVVTGAQRAQVIPVLEAAGLAELFEVVITLEDVGAGKPDPACYLLALDRMRPSPGQRVLAVEDSVVGLRSAKAAGLTTIAISGSCPPDILAAEADHLVDQLHPGLVGTAPFWS